MKKSVKLLSILLAFIMMVQGTIVASASLVAKSNYTGKTYTHQTRFDNMTRFNGVDVSEHNGKVDWKALKKNGVDFAFIRVGYTGYRRDRHSLNYDPYYVDNINNAISNGIAVGVYWYSQALNEAEARAEAERLTKVLADFKITLPVVMDYEFADVSTGRLDCAWKDKTLNKDKMTANAIAFLDEVNKAGYDACLYANKNFLTNMVDSSLISKSYKIWLAHYNTYTDFTGDFEFWQYSSSGKIAGKKFDVNYWYFDNSTKYLEDYIYTGEEIKPVPVIMDKKNVLLEDEDYTLSYSNNINIGTAQIVATGINDYEGQKWNYKFKIKPDRVAGLKLDQSRTTNTISIKWKKVEGAKSYSVYVKNKTKGTSFSFTSTPTDTIIGNLTPGNQYQIKVKAICNGTNGDYSVPLTAHTVPDKVTGVKTSSRTTSSVTLSWDKKAGASGYKIYLYYPSKKEAVQVGTVSGVNNTSYKINNRKQGTVYYYKVAAYVSDEGISDRTGYKSSQHATTPSPKKQSVTKISSSSSKKLYFRWDGTKCSGYQVQWSPSSDFSSNVKSATVTGRLSTTVTTNQSKKKYYVRVRAYKTVNNKKVYGAWSSAKSVKVK